MLAAGETFGVFSILGYLGGGTMADVYLAHQFSPRREVALKVIKPELAAMPAFRARFQREANVLAQLEHPHILPVYEVGEAEGLPFICYRYIRGGTLKDLLTQPLSAPEVVQLLAPVADALDFAHGEGVIHRDIKPANILLTLPDNRGLRTPLVADFGIARLLERSLAGGDAAQTSTDSGELTQVGAGLGTPAYMAPEQVLGYELDGRVDQYALGITAYQLLTASLPYAARTPTEHAYKQVSEPLPPPSSRNVAISQTVDHVVQKALAKDRDLRYPTCTLFIAALAAAASTPPPRQQMQSPGTPGFYSPPRQSRPPVPPAPAAVPVPAAALGAAGPYPSLQQSPPRASAPPRNADGPSRDKLRLLLVGCLAVILLSTLAISGVLIARSRSHAASSTARGNGTGTAQAAVPSASVSVPPAVPSVIATPSVVVPTVTATPTPTPSPPPTQPAPPNYALADLAGSCPGGRPVKLGLSPFGGPAAIAGQGLAQSEPALRCYDTVAHAQADLPKAPPPPSGVPGSTPVFYRDSLQYPNSGQAGVDTNAGSAGKWPVYWDASETVLRGEGIQSNGWLLTPKQNVQDGAIAVDAHMVAGIGSGGLQLSCRSTGVGRSYRLVFFPETGRARIERTDGPNVPNTSLTETKTVSAALDNWPVTLALRCVGSDISASVNGQQVLQATDSTYTTGTFDVGIVMYTKVLAAVAAKFHNLVLIKP